MADDRLVLDASAMVDLLIGAAPAPLVARRLRGQQVHVPAHFDAEVLSALGRLQRSAVLTVAEVLDRLDLVTAATFERHALAPLLRGAWGRRENIRVVDALYLELAEQLGAPLVSTDTRLGAASPRVEVLTT